MYHVVIYQETRASRLCLAKALEKELISQGPWTWMEKSYIFIFINLSLKLDVSSHYEWKQETRVGAWQEQ